MYHCHIQFYLTGVSCSVFEEIRKMPPLENFTHTFCWNETIARQNAAKADVIFANLQGMDPEEIRHVLEACGDGEPKLILLASAGQFSALSGHLETVRDIWIVPMTEDEIRFRFARWQQTCRTEKDFWERSQYLESTINHIPSLIWYKDKEGVHEKVNDSFCRTVGKTKEQVEGQRHAYIWDVEEDDPACIESELEVMRRKETCVSEEIIKTGDGMRTLTTYKSPLYDLDGSVMGTVGVAIDVTQERAYEKEIIKKNQTLETIFTAIDCGVMLHSADGSQVYSVNRAALKILGYDSLEEMMAGGFDLVAGNVLEEDRKMLQGRIRRLKRKGDSVSVEYRVRHKDGEILHVMGNVKLLEKNGELVYQRFLLDCTAQKQQEKQKERHQMELVRALSIDYNLVCSFDLDTGMGRLVQNTEQDVFMRDLPASGEISLEESMHHYIENYVCGEDREMLRQACSRERIGKELEEKKQYYVNYRTPRDGGIKYFQIKVVRIGTWNERRDIVLGIRSVDEEIRSEMEQKGLLEDALMQANRASRAKSVFLSNMSHDIRTPMNAIVGFTNLAITHIDNREQVEDYLGKIMTSGNHLLSLINDVLDMSHIESGKIHLEEKPCSLPEILHGLHNILQADIHAKQLELQMDTVDVVNEEIYCDKLRLNQVLLNLLSNAVKYTGPGGKVDLRITEKDGAPEGCAVYEFCVRDTGIGMSEEFVQHIFEPFERESNSTISRIQGTGLGMAITKNIVDMMHGSIEVKSKQGVGTEFTVSFTFRLYHGAEKPQNIPELKNCRALVVDDDFNTCDSVSYMLSQLGMRAEWTLSGKEAVLRTHQAITRGDEYHVYIVDWLLPDMNGVEVARRIRKETGGNGPVVVLTAYDWSDIEEEAREAGVAAFCSKPLFLSELRNCLRSVIAPGEEKTGSTKKEAVKRHTGRILLAEDVELNQEIATVILEDAGFTVDVADNGKIAVEMLSKSDPGYYQVILMDVQMPVMNGYEATREIRNLEDKGLASIPIIAMTANAFEEDRQAALRAGMNGHIAKPIDLRNLFDALDRALGE